MSSLKSTLIKKTLNIHRKKLKYMKKKPINKEEMREKKKKLKNYRQWFEHNRNTINTGNWENTYKNRRFISSIKEQGRILSDIDDSMAEEGKIYDPFIN